MTSITQQLIQIIFIAVFSTGCMAIGYLMFGKVLDKISRRSEYVDIAGEKLRSEELSSYITGSVNRLPAPNLQILESLMLTMETVNTCLDTMSDKSALMSSEIHKQIAVNSHEKETKKQDAK